MLSGKDLLAAPAKTKGDETVVTPVEEASPTRAMLPKRRQLPPFTKEGPYPMKSEKQETGKGEEADGSRLIPAAVLCFGQAR